MIKNKKKELLKKELVRFNKKFYPKYAVKKAIADFSELANFDFNESKGYFILKVKDIFFEGNGFADEFSNYVLGLIKK